MKHPNFLVEDRKSILRDIYFVIKKTVYFCRGSTGVQPAWSFCSDLKQAATQKVIIKNQRNMKKKALLMLFMMLSVVGFSQSATIDGSVCASAPDCPKYVCENSTISLLAGITSGSIDSLKWRERISINGGGTWSGWTTIGTNLTRSVPVGEVATIGHIYRYQLIIYQGGIQYFALSDVYVNAAPTATLLCNDTTICAGINVTFSASAGGTSYDFRINGASIQSGASSIFTTSALVNGDNITVTITNGNGCVKTSLPISMVVYPLPSVTSVTGNSTLGCVGQNGNATITGLTGTAPWSLEIWTDVSGNPGVLYYAVPGTTAIPNTVIPVPISVIGFETLHLRITDVHGCKNF